MVDPGLLRLLELVTRELECSDSRIEIGGKDPTDEKLVHRPLQGTGRIVAVFDAPPADRKSAEQRLEALVSSFSTTAEPTTIGPSSSRTPPDIATRRLDDELTNLAERAAAKGCVVFDMTSPVVWGASRSTDDEIDRLLEDVVVKVRGSQTELRNSHVARVRIGPDHEALARPFAGVYVIALVYEGEPSELVGVGTLLHGLPLIERLVLALPPIDPGPSGGKVVRLPARLR